MGSSINIIDDLQNNIINRDCNFRGLNANFNKVLVFIKSLVIKPCIIVCSETRNLVHPEFFNITKGTKCSIIMVISIKMMAW